MRITIHGHRPFFLRPPAHTASRTPAIAQTPADLPPVDTGRNINLGFFKLKVHRQTARQAELISQHQAQQQRQHIGDTASTTAAPTSHAQNAGTPTISMGSPAGASHLHAERALTPILDVAGEQARTEPTPTGPSQGHTTSLPEPLPEGEHRPDLRDNHLTTLTEHLAARLDVLRENQFSRLVGHALTHLPDNAPGTLRELASPGSPGYRGATLRFSRSHPVTPLSDSPPSTPRTPDLPELDLLLTDPDPDRVTGMQSRPSTPPAGPRPAIEPHPRTPDQPIPSLSITPRLRQRPRGQTLVDIDMLPTLPLLDPVAPGQGRSVSGLRYLAHRLFDEVGALHAQTLEPCTLGQAVTAWTQEDAASNTAQTSRLWDGFAEEPGAQAFSGFLERLRGSVNFRNPEFRVSVAQWLPELAANPPLRRDTFLVSQGATTSCEDRVALSFNEMQKLRLASEVARGDYDSRIPELMNLARGMFRLDQLEQISREHVAGAPHNVDPIEVYLGYQVALREALALPVETRSMRFFGVAGLTDQDLRGAQERVASAEQKDFPDYFASEWQPWQAVLQRLAPERYAQSRDELMDALGDEFHTRLQGRLRAMGLENDSDAEREMGPQVQAEITREINARLTKDFLAERGLSDILGTPVQTPSPRRPSES